MTTANQTEVREFTKTDWYGYGGAERWPDSEPLIAYGGNNETGEPDRAVVADSQGLQVEVGFDWEDENTGVYMLPIKLTPALARLWMPALLTVSPADMMNSGFVKLG
jgi:hypothetical protein